MGCSAKESLEDQMLLMKLDRLEIQMEKEMQLKKLGEMHGAPVRKSIIPDYIDPVFAKENNLYEGEDEDDNDNDNDEEQDFEEDEKNEKNEEKKVNFKSPHRKTIKTEKLKPKKNSKSTKNVKRYTEFGDFNVKTDRPRKKEKLKDRIKRKNSN
jgi:hypothetical protein